VTLTGDQRTTLRSWLAAGKTEWRLVFRALWLDAPIRPVHPYIRSRGIQPVAGRTPSFNWNSITNVRH
jgi:hypothetical protein